MIKSNKNSVKDNEKISNEVPNDDAKDSDNSSGIPPQGDDVRDTREDLKNKNKEIESLTDMLKRRQADFENYKKRVIRDQAEYQKLAVKDFACDIIDINDDILRAVESASEIRDEKTQAFVDGVRIISKRIEETLKKYGIQEIDSLNKEFDPRFNEAVEINTREDVTRDMITGVYQKGFRLDDYVIRCAKVRVTKPAAAGNNSKPADVAEEIEGNDNCRGCGCGNGNDISSEKTN